MLTKISNKWEVALPRRFRDALGMKPGDILNVRIKDGKILLTPKNRRGVRRKL